MHSYMHVQQEIIATFSLSLSRAEVASSSNSILGSLTKARAMAIRCFCPPDNWVPCTPTFVL